MAQQIINVGSLPNDGTGDKLRDSMIKVQGNFTDLYQNIYNALTEATSPNAGTITGSEYTPLSRGTGLLQSTLTTTSQWSLQTYQGYIANDVNAISRTVNSKLQETVSIEDFGAVGDGVTDDTSAFTKACKSNRRLRLSRNKTYLIRNLSVLGISNFELDGNGGTIVSDQTHSILGFNASGWGISSNIYVHDLTLFYTNSPNSRTDNVFPLWFQFINGVHVERVQITNSWSAGIIYSVCSNVHAYKNNISNTLADGMTCFGCGRNVTYFDNYFNNTADDAMAVTWLAGNTAVAVGETTICTKGVRILYNHVDTTTVSARGVFIGGIIGGIIQGNRFINVAAFSILISNTTTVANFSTDVQVCNNIMENSGQTASSLVGEVGGLAVYSQNLNISVYDNEIINANNIGMLLQGNVDATNNFINGVTNTPSVTNPSLLWLGAGIAWADFSGSNTCYGSSNFNRIWNTTNRAIWIQAGYNAQYLSVCNNEIHDCVSTSVGTAATGVIFLDSSTRNQVIAKGNRFYESRTTQTLTVCIYVAGGGLHDIDHVEINLASGATQPNTPIANASGGTAIKRWLQATISAGTIAANSTFAQNFSVADANLRDYVFVSVPYQIPGLIVSAFVQSANVVTVQVTNPTTSPITPLQGNTWTIRVRRT